jgi:hypothetical protein
MGIGGSLNGDGVGRRKHPSREFSRSVSGCRSAVSSQITVQAEEGGAGALIIAATLPEPELDPTCAPVLG